MAKKTTTSKKPGTKAPSKPAAKAAPKAAAKAPAKAAPKANAKSSTKPGKAGTAGSSSKSAPAKNPPTKAVKDATLTTKSQTPPTSKPTSKPSGKPSAKPASKTPAKPASNSAKKPAKSPAKESAKESAKTPSKQVSQSNSKTETKTETKSGTKAGAKSAAKAPAKSDTKATVAAVAETKPSPKAPSKSTSKAPAKPEPKAEAKPEAKQPDPKLDPKAAAAANAAGRKGITVVTPKPQRKPSNKSSASKFVSPGGNLLGPGLPARKPLIPSGPSATRPVSLGDGADLAGKKSPFNKKELARYKALLLAKRVELIGDVNNMENEALRSSAGSLSNLPQHMADQGSDAYDQSLALDLAAADRRLIKEIDDALQRIEDGTYGLCEITGQPIKIDRLDEIPWARHSIEAAREVERRTHRL